MFHVNLYLYFYFVKLWGFVLLTIAAIGRKVAASLGMGSGKIAAMVAGWFKMLKKFFTAILRLLFLKIKHHERFPQKAILRKKDVKNSVTILNGQFESSKSLLNGLDPIFENIEFLTKGTSIKQAVKSFGVHVSNSMEQYELEGNVLNEIKAYGAPTVICSTIPYFFDDSNNLCNTIFFAEKCSRIPRVEFPKNEHIYKTTQVLSVPNGKFKTKPIEFDFILGVNKITGKIRVLRFLKLNAIQIKSKNKRGYTEITQQEWKLGSAPQLEDHQKTIDPEKFTCDIFETVFKMTMARENSINIYAKKNKFKCTFCVPQDKWKTFFKDREPVVIDGKTKRIFHFVSAHARKNGSYVRTHCKGLREFNWNGYDIKIVVQGKHGLSQADFGITGTDETYIDSIKGTLTLGQVGKNLEPMFENYGNGKKNYSEKHSKIA